ncbi:Sec20-domain-containing protein [Xylariaceae sp. FL0016]|nr:Sec20-domain-containing protein [Xylariaceae sp. FL0016]
MSLEALEKRFADLQDRLAVLQDATNQLKELIERLAKFDFRPGSIPLAAGEDDNVGSELSSEINQILREQEEELELFHEEILDIRPGKAASSLQHDKDRLKDGAQRLEQELQSCRKSFRKAQITAKRNLQIAQRQERELLYASFVPPRSGASSPASATVPTPLAPASRRKYKDRSEMSKEEQMLHANNDVTQSLRRAHDMMATELSKSDFAQNALKESTAALAQLSENYSSLDTMLSGSQALLRTLLKSQKTDTWYLGTALMILIVTIGWLVFRRLLWGPTWLLIWLPLKLLYKGSMGVASTVGLRNSQVNPGSSSVAVDSGPQQVEMNNKGVPTLQVGQPPEQSQETTADESLMEHVGRIVDESNQDPIEGDDKTQGVKEDTVLRDRGEEEPSNPKKRMMEEEPGASHEKQRIKDEL